MVIGSRRLLFKKKKSKGKEIVLMSLPVEISLQCEVEVFVNALGKQGRGHVTRWGLHYVRTKLWNF